MSDHLPTLALMKQTKITDKNPIEFNSRLLNSLHISNIDRKQQHIDWIGHLNSESCDTNFNTFCNLLHETMDTVAPLKCVCISAKRKFSEPWLTQGIETSNRKIKQLYKETLKSNCSTKSLIKYKQHQNLLNRIKQKAKTSYYNTKCEGGKHGGSIIPYISIDGVKTYNPKKISNAFGSFFVNLGSDLAKKKSKMGKLALTNTST